MYIGSKQDSYVLLDNSYSLLGEIQRFYKNFLFLTFAWNFEFKQKCVTNLL